MMTDLELASTAELIAELIGRATFQGVVISADGRVPEWVGQRHFSYSRVGLTADQALNLIETVVAYSTREDWSPG